MFSRAELRTKGMNREARVGDGWLANPRLVTNAAAGNQNITLDMVQAGVGLFTGAAGAVAYTWPTAAAILAANTDMDIGDTLVVVITNTAAQVATLTTNAGLTLAGFTTINATRAICLLTKTSATEMTITAI